MNRLKPCALGIIFGVLFVSNFAAQQKANGIDERGALHHVAPEATATWNSECRYLEHYIAKNAVDDNPAH